MNAQSPTVAVERSERSPAPTGKRAAWLVGFGVAACAGCCVAPVLVALGVGAVAAAAIGVWIERIAGAVFVAALIVGALAWSRRRRAAEPEGCATSCSTDRSCGCGSVKEDTCTLPRSEGPERLERFRAVFVALIATRREARAVVFEIDKSARPQIEELTRLESQCCSFLRFEINEQGERVVWRVDGPPSARSMLDLFADLPRLARDEEGLAEALDRLDARGGQHQQHR